MSVKRLSELCTLEEIYLLLVKTFVSLCVVSLFVVPTRLIVDEIYINFN